MRLCLILFCCWIQLVSCVQEEPFDNTPLGNFNACWKILDQKYCFFEYKRQQYGLDWNEVYDQYYSEIDPSMTQEELFGVLERMLRELRDGHVNLYTDFDVARYWNWFSNYPDNFDPLVHLNYLTWEYRVAGGFQYRYLPNSIGYIYYDSMKGDVSHQQLDEVLGYFSHAKGIIFDIRNNGGGQLCNVNLIVSRFTEQSFCSGYIVHKTGPGHEDFSVPFAIDQPACPEGRICWKKPVMLLTNRSVFSAANQLVNVMRYLPQVSVIGDWTGGGSGLPFHSLLPNGWRIRFSASPVYDLKGENTEFGIPPDVRQEMDVEAQLEGKDSIIERAIQMILAAE